MILLLLLLAVFAQAQTGSRIDFTPGSSSGNPTAGRLRLWANSATGNLECLNSSGGACMVGSTPLSSIQNPAAVTTFNVGTFGTTFSSTDPSIGDPNDGKMMSWTCTYDQNSTINPGTSKNCLELLHVVNIGQGLLGGGTTGKETIVAFSKSATYPASGQKVMEGKTVNCYGMSDCSTEQWFVTTAGGPVSGDEGQGFMLHSTLQQPDGPIVSAAINSVPQSSGCPSNMTLTQSVTQSLTVQTVTVSSSTGCLVNDWVVADWLGPTGYANWDYVQITAVGAGTISGKFLANHNNGATVKSAVWFRIDNNNFKLGQDRVLVNMSGTSYTSGTAVTQGGCGTPAPSFCDTHQVGTGTVWTNGVVGGDALDPGCFSYTGDNQTYAPFSAGNPLISWWEIQSVTDNTHLNLFSFSTSGAQFYGGVGTGAYIIRPCARILYFVPDGSLVVLAPNSFTWTNGDSVQQPYVPYPDTTGFQFDMRFFSPGAITRGFVQYQNTGGQQISCAICVVNGMRGNNAANSPSAFYVAIAGATFESNPVVDYMADLTSFRPKKGAMLLGNAGLSAVSDYQFKWGTGSGDCTDTVNPPEFCIGFPLQDTSRFRIGNGQRYIGLPASSGTGTTAFFIGLGKININPDFHNTNAITLDFSGTNASFTQTFSNQTGQVGLWIATTTVGALPGCNSGNPGTYTFVTDSNTTVLGAIPGGSGTNRVPVKCDGTNWRVG